MTDIRRTEAEPDVTEDRDGRCACGHRQTGHHLSAGQVLLDLPPGTPGHGGCGVYSDGAANGGPRIRCSCPKFTWVGDWPKGER